MELRNQNNVDYDVDSITFGKVKPLSLELRLHRGIGIDLSSKLTNPIYMEFPYLSPNKKQFISVVIYSDQPKTKYDENLVNLLDKEAYYIDEYVNFIEQNASRGNAEHEAIITLLETYKIDSKDVLKKGDIVELSSAEFEVKESNDDITSAYLVVNMHECDKPDLMYPWQLKNIKNIHLQEINMESRTQDKPILHNNVIKLSKDEVILLDGNCDIDWGTRYLLIKYDQLKSAHELLKQKLADETKKTRQSYDLQFDCLKRKIPGTLQERFKDKSKYVYIDLNTNHMKHGLTPDLAAKGIPFNKRGAVSRRKLKSNQCTQLCGKKYTEVIIPPNRQTLADGSRIHMKNCELLWSNSSLKLYLKFTVVVEDIPLE